MDRALFFCGILLLFLSLFQSSQGVKCYQCTYIEGSDGRDMNPHCLSNVGQETVHSEEGVACLTAEGEIDGQSFIVRRAFLPGMEPPKAFPKEQASIKCDDYRVISFGGAGVTSVSDRKVDKLISCSLCNEADNCNSAVKLSFGGGGGLAVILTVIACIFGTFLNF